jgi:hypothetical protein
MGRHKIIFKTIIIALILTFATPLWATIWHVPGDFATIQGAIDNSAVIDGDTIMVGTGNHAGALVDKNVEIKGESGATINSGPMHPAGLSYGFRLNAASDGTTISHLTFTVDLAIMNGEAVSDVTVSHCTFLNTIQAVSNWRGSGWEISHNVILDLRTRNGGGIGILVADYAGGMVASNVVSHNKISGTLHVSAGDGGGYDGSGIVLYADFRWGRAGAKKINENRVVKNKVSLVSDNKAVVDVCAIELTDTRDNPEIDCVIFSNAIGFNDMRGTEKQLQLTPTNLDGCNEISRNFGENRGHGLHPTRELFGPGGN